MANFKFNPVSFGEITSSPEGIFMLDAIRFKGDNLIVYGPPGCGKSTIAAHRLEFLKQDNKTAIYLTYNNLLKEYIRQSFKNDNPSRDKIYTFFSTFGFTKNEIDFLEKNYKNNRQECDELIQLKISEYTNNFDEIIIDEGQDLPFEIYGQLLKKAKNISIFLDRAQSLYEIGIQQQEFTPLKTYGTEFQLVVNHRNPKTLYEFALQLNPEGITKSDLKLMRNVSGEIVQVYKCENEELELKEILDIINDNKTSNIGILLGNNQSEVDRFCQKLNNTEYNGKYTKFHSNSNLNLEEFKNVMVTTFKSAKGLEFDIVIIPNIIMGGGNYYIDDKLLFVAFTRAREQLVITYINGNNFVKNRINNFDRKTYHTYERTKKETSIEDIPF